MSLGATADRYHIGCGDLLELALQEATHPRQRELIREAMQFEVVE